MAVAAARSHGLTPAELIKQAEEAFASAREKSAVVEHDVTLAGRHVRLAFAGDAFRADFERALAYGPPGVDAQAAPTLTLSAWDAASTSAPIEAGSWLGLMLGPAGVVEGLSDDRYDVSLDLHASLMSALDTARGLGFHYAQDASLLPAWEVTHPARMLWSAWSRSQGMQLCHAAAVAHEGRGVLLAGPSGSGKSTTTLACLAAGMSSAGDDYVLVEGNSAAPVAHALFRSMSLDAGHADAFSQLMPAPDRQLTMSPQRTKAVVFADEQVGGSFPLVAVVVPRVTAGAASGWAGISAGAALRALAPSTMGQLGTFNSDALRQMSDLCRQLPCYELRLGQDVDELPRLVVEIIDRAENTRRAPTEAAATA
jgi:hypothetical protein